MVCSKNKEPWFFKIDFEYWLFVQQELMANLWFSSLHDWQNYSKITIMNKLESVRYGANWAIE